MLSIAESPPKTWFYQFARRLLTILLAIFYPCKLLNPEGFQLDAPFILIANHQSMLDPVLLAVKLKKYEIRFIGKRELTKNKVLNWIFKRLHMIAVTRHMSDMTAMRAAGAALKQGHVLGIFPEGTRRNGKAMESIESGVSLLALRSGVPLVPVLICGRPGLFRKTKMVVGPVIPYDDLLATGMDKASGEALNSRIQMTYEAMQNKCKE
jgi:1-acyl-sn-glycerol-3-phosphate acyltransferase